jgi:hypothetical protein
MNPASSPWSSKIPAATDKAKSASLRQAKNISTQIFPEEKSCSSQALILDSIGRTMLIQFRRHNAQATIHVFRSKCD